MAFDLIACLVVCLLVTAPLIGRRVFDYYQRKRFERLVDRVGGQ